MRHVVLARDGRERARRNAERLVALETRLGLHVEPAVQDAVLRAPRLGHALSVGYAAANVALSVGWLLVLYRSGDPGYPRERTAALVAFTGALPVFLAWPVAPPRTLDGFVDALAERGVELEHPFLVRFYNPVAALPSQHLAFATVTGWALAGRARTRLGRLGWRSYPPFVGLVVVATGNHFLLDVAAGAALGAGARLLSR